MPTLDLQKVLEDSGAILRGHFLLSSGRHSDVYLEKFRLIEQPKVLSLLCSQIAEAFAGNGIELVAGPLTGGIIIAFEVARQMGLSAVYIETEDGKKRLRRGAAIPSGAKVLVVDDVLTTGGSVFEVLDVVRQAGGAVAGVGILLDRSESPVDFGVASFACHRVEAKSYLPDDVPDWLAAIPVRKPGTRAG